MHKGQTARYLKSSFQTTLNPPHPNEFSYDQSKLALFEFPRPWLRPALIEFHVHTVMFRPRPSGCVAMFLASPCVALTAQQQGRPSAFGFPELSSAAPIGHQLQPILFYFAHKQALRVMKLKLIRLR